MNNKSKILQNWDSFPLTDIGKLFIIWKRSLFSADFPEEDEFAGEVKKPENLFMLMAK